MPPDEDKYALALEEARRAVDTQRDDLKGVRDRATAVVTVAGLALSLLAGPALRDPRIHPSGWTIAGVAAFVLLTGVALGILWPRTFIFAQDPQTLVAWAEQQHAQPAEMTRDLALHLKGQYAANRTAIKWMLVGYQVAVALLALEILALLLDLRGR
jgi:hypothetical protein